MCGTILQSKKQIVKEKFEAALAKDDGISLWEHSVGTLEICNHLINCIPDYDSDKAWQLRLAAFLHDIGKLDLGFQEFINKESSNPIKHEKQSLNYKDWVAKNLDSIAEIIRYYCEITPTEPNFEDIWGFIVSHHGIYYLEIKDDKWKVARDWTKVNTADSITVSLADLLWRYYPLGGAVIFADLIHSAYLNGNNFWNEIKKINTLECIKEKIAGRCQILVLEKGVDRREMISLDVMKLLLLN